MLGVPLKRNGNFVGVLQMEWYKVRAQSDRQVHLLEITAERCAMAILNAQLFEKTKQLQERLQLQIDRMPIGCILCDRHLFITEWNPAAEKIFRFTKAEILGKNAIETIVPPSERSHVREILNRVARGDMNAANINKNITNDGCLITCEWSNTPLIASDGTFLGLLLMVQDITERQRANEQLRQYANYDPLTGLPRRSLLLERIKTLLAETQERDRPLFAVLHLDINRFQAIKYSLGHDIAEQLLVAMARRLEACLHPPAMLVRVEADEFAILLEAVSTSSEANRMAEQIQQAIAQPFKLNGHELFTSASIGLVLSSLPNADPEDLCQAADVAMHHAKTSGYKYVVFDRALQVQALRRLQLDADLRRALDRQEFQVHYQPIVALQTLELVGFEALVRWHSPTEGIVAPSEFIPLAEETGAIVPLGTWVLHQACQQMQRWQQRFSNRATLTISVNLSAMQLKQLDSIEQIDWILRDTGLPARCLKLEITESALIEDTNRTINILERLKAKQIHLCVDDFGTGYSSLSYLHAFPFDTLKVDRSFISRLGDELANAEIVPYYYLVGEKSGYGR
ncbi:MAG: EAL domain-containing protein [Coleofasciculaceae cyanobacterium SM2_3_26]|nr:EAL domain-containing protein [Coleofasciculaceae cyanobacterium SM2_3_26]